MITVTFEPQLQLEQSTDFNNQIIVKLKDKSMLNLIVRTHKWL